MRCSLGFCSISQNKPEHLIGGICEGRNALHLIQSNAIRKQTSDWPYTNGTPYFRQNLTPIISTIKWKVLKLYGQTKCCNQGVSKICLDGTIDGKIDRGKQPKHWLDNITNWTGQNLISLNNAANNWNLWRKESHVDALSAEGGEGIWWWIRVSSS